MAAVEPRILRAESTDEPAGPDHWAGRRSPFTRHTVNSIMSRTSTRPAATGTRATLYAAMLALLLTACSRPPDSVPAGRFAPISSIAGQLPGVTDGHLTITPGVYYPGGGMLELVDPRVTFALDSDGSFSGPLPTPGPGESLPANLRSTCGMDGHHLLQVFVAHTNPSAANIPLAEVQGLFARRSGGVTVGLWYSPTDVLIRCSVEPGVAYFREDFDLHLRTGWNALALYVVGVDGYYRTGASQNLPWVRLD